MEAGNSKQWGCASILLIIGAILLLLNLGIINLDGNSFTALILPIIFLVIGLSRLLRFVQTRSKGLFLGSFFTVYGALILVSYFGQLDFTYGDWWKLWPLILIVIAISIFRPKGKISISYDNKKNHPNKGSSVKKEFKGSYKTKVFTVGDVKYNNDNWTLDHMRIHKGVGNYYFNFAKAYVPEGETVVHLSGWVGDVKMLIPEDLSVQIDASVNVGDISIFNNKEHGPSGNHLTYRSPDYEDAFKRVYIKIDINVGHIQINHV